MSRLRRYYRRHVGRHARFHLAVLLTIVVVTYLVVPWIVGLIEAGRGYSPVYYEPKDFTRQDYVPRHGGVPAPAVAPWKPVVNVILVFLVVIVWMSLLPPGGARRR